MGGARAAHRPKVVESVDRMRRVLQLPREQSQPRTQVVLGRGPRQAQPIAVKALHFPHHLGATTN